MEELLNQISTKITRKQKEIFWISKIDLEYAFGQLKLSEPSSFATTRRNVNGHYRFLKRLYSLSDIPTKFHEKIDQTLISPTQVWLGDIQFVTRGITETPEKNHLRC